MESAAEHPAGGGVEGERKVEELVENPGRPGGREVQPGGVGLIFTDAGRRVPAEDDAGSEASEWGLRERRERDEERGGCGGAGRRGGVATAPPRALLHGIRGRGVGVGGRDVRHHADSLCPPRPLGSLSFAISLVRSISF